MSKLTIICLSLMSAVVGGLVVGGLLNALPKLSFQTESRYELGTGDKFLTEFQCGYGQTKHIMMRGGDDDYDSEGGQDSRPIPDVAHLPGHPSSHVFRRSYDERGVDSIFTDYFDLPSDITNGVFTIRLTQNEADASDLLSLGDLWVSSDNPIQSNAHTFNSRIKALPHQTGWTDHGLGRFSAELADIIFTSGNPAVEADISRQFKSLLPYLQKANGKRRLEVHVEDDTAVDYIGLALCTLPDENMGVSFSEYKYFSKQTDGLVMLTCGMEFTQNECNAIIGDTSCQAALPLACFKDTDNSAPDNSLDLPKHIQNSINKFWSAGDIGFSPAVRGDAIKNLSQADAICAKNLGEGWRVLDYHRGGIRNIVGRRYGPVPEGRFWIDIKDQPAGTCWARNGETDEHP